MLSQKPSISYSKANLVEGRFHPLPKLPKKGGMCGVMPKVVELLNMIC
jgi:hypothetical protein